MSAVESLQKNLKASPRTWLVTGVAGDIRHSLANISKAIALLGYTPTHRVAEGIDDAMNWYLSHCAFGMDL